MTGFSGRILAAPDDPRPPSVPARKEQLLPLTSLRFFAAFSIVIFHLSTAGLLPIAGAPALAAGVSFFFVLSGFILQYNYTDLRGGIGHFYVSRIARLWPLHFMTILLLFFLLPGFSIWAVHPDGRWIFAANLLLLQAWIPSPAFAYSFNGVSWSISVELFFYACFPLLLKSRSGKKLNRLNWM